MRRCYVITLLSLQLSLLWSAVTCIRCYQCNSIKTPSCTRAGDTSDWQTCHDDHMCLTGIGVARVLGNRRNRSSSVIILILLPLPLLLITRNSSADEIANVNFLYDDIIHRTRTTKYHRLVHKFRHRSTRLCAGTQVYQSQ